jgi:integrase
MSVTKRGGKWLARWVIDGRHVARTFDLKDSAVAWEADARRRAQLGAHATAEPSRDTLNVWLEVYWTRESPRWAQSTPITRAQLLDKWIEPYLGGVRLRDLGTARVRERLLTSRVTGARPASATPRTEPCRRPSASRHGTGSYRRPCQGIRRAPHTPARPRALTPAEIERIRQEMPTARGALLVALMAYGGLRPEEVVPLRWSDLATGVIVVDRAYTFGELKTKTGTRRAVEIVDPLADDIAAVRPHTYGGGDLIAPSRMGRFLDWGNWLARLESCVRGGRREGRTVRPQAFVREPADPRGKEPAARRRWRWGIHRAN